MKVCTDATLFGAMAPIKGGERVLDIGAGTGLLSLMVLQLGAAEATAVELTEEACRDARNNFAASPWADRMTLVHQSIQAFAESCGHRFDLIMSNPPFFDQHSKNPEALRQIARHTDQLPHGELIQIVSQLLTDQGQFYLLIPVAVIPRIVAAAEQHGLALSQRVDYAGYSYSQAKVAALTFKRIPERLVHRRLDIYNAPRIYTEESTRYLRPFLLRFSEVAQP